VEIVILAGAESDLFEAWKYYEQLIPGLGERFDDAVEEGLGYLAQFPRSAPRYAQEFRRLVLRDFAYGIFYRLHGERLVVVAALDLRQDPGSIQRRLGTS
jgi:toxin ParE1/3/4